jgi:UDP-N-acetylglucosamine diphosphorylase/glucosamine-1-phosphate N-acetyltransferase
LFKLEPIIAMDFILFDDQLRSDFYPFTLTRPVSELRLGMMTIREKWEKALKGRAYCVTAPWLAAKFAGNVPPERPFVWINARYLPTEPLVQAILQLIEGQLIQQDGVPVALFGAMDAQKGGNPTANFQVFNAPGELSFISKVWELFTRNAEWIKQDFQALTHGRKSAKISSSNRIIGEDIFFEEGAVAEMSIINTTTGPVYLAAHAEIMEGCMVRGALAMGEHATLKMGAKIYGPTTLGPQAKVGGEVSNSVILGYSNKGHDGFLGNSIIGEWCNLGADTNNSNLKNNYGLVKIWSMARKKMEDTGLTFCGLMMGDHSKAGINTMFNTGTVTGVCANIFDGGFPPKFIPSFSWGGKENSPSYEIEKALETAKAMYSRRGVVFSEEDEKLLRYLSMNQNTL